ncbi:MAG: hypothetical protein DMD61_05210 [Gemmatimonadetes bacterium]|nr:MAG: hypothetical protein DMD61_05210 [Gemmatimonadota bacterium]
MGPGSEGGLDAHGRAGSRALRPRQGRGRIYALRGRGDRGGAQGDRGREGARGAAGPAGPAAGGGGREAGADRRRA